jgi:hypothetical protein
MVDETLLQRVQKNALSQAIRVPHVEPFEHVFLALRSPGKLQATLDFSKIQHKKQNQSPDTV